MFCTHCGSSLEENSNFCGSCGASQGGSQPGFAPGPGANPQYGPSGYNYGAAGLPPIQAYYGNNSVNMQGQGYIPPITPRPYSHSLTLGLISISSIFLVAITIYMGTAGIFFALIGLGLSITALILGAVHLGKRSCAAGGFVLGIIFTFYNAILFFAAVSLNL